ncbi:PLP-dependent aminotransferase family protein [Skermania sp. ID1734]|uniref:aminotransferase-like domain-containing protein n=1 Tax=Skermania sp. ID1734 TaxID=2597516 RepID=UPI00117E271A|nr:PLP-dependent aminotransferase family protein [Skermania sp. ID1734]TSE02022.1 PLP-dependent aminotransferase family protein [Skermania sp. ID1734]
MPAYPRLAARLDEMRSSAIRDLLTVTARPEIVSLAGGLPDPELVPRDRITEAAQRALQNLDSIQYTETPGWAGLREVVAARESALLDRTVDSNEVLITHGSQQALSLLAQVLLDPGDTVVVEDPGYTGALQVFRSAQARLVGIPVTAEGMDIDALESELVAGARPALVHTVSNFHNPASATLSMLRRARLAELAQRYGFWVIEDDPYGEIWFDNPPPKPVASLSDRVIRLSSASKILAPALRTGWLVAPEHVCKAIELVKQGTDLCGSALNHRMAAELLTDEDWLAAHLDTVRSSYGRRATTLRAALLDRFGDVLAMHPVDGGMFCWASFTDGTDTESLLRAALDIGVAFVPGSAFAVDVNGYGDSLRMCFTTASDEVLMEAVDRLGRAHDSLRD